ncbi:uncharacterized protein N7477_001201 [Penicillium maclennaniae]|uniref:uncharacterized protein n=1 Tax=Penicillium maclennaniae TaxID=1343394 RepID=UPI002541DE3E|nr:uncharacterized protein N7477_001201 [Penicillium maclennaniae]KAJ5684856.1 hypothetical protein N7477_001201 [Penicillium maclennaniae]
MSPPVSRIRMPSGSEDQPGNGGMFVFDSKLAPKTSSSRISKRNHSDELHELRNRLRTLEHALSKSNAIQTPDTSVGDFISENCTSQHSSDAAGVEDRVRFLPDSSFRGKNGKTRYFGRSHYTTTVSFFQDIGSFLRRGHKNQKDKELHDMKKFKCELWSRESQSHQRAFRDQAFSLHEMVPARNVADELLQLYLDSFETTYRVLHIPTFMKQYSDYWDYPQKPDMAFVAQLLAVLAAGSCFHMSMEAEARETYQTPAMKWIMGVQSYISCSFVSPEINLRMLQTQTLLLVARLGVANDGDVAWASSGSLIRSAMTMGLHRDPTRFRKGGSPILISLDRGVTPSVDLDECDCDAPSNWDDADLVESLENNPTPLSTATYTRNFYQTLLSKSLPLRYLIAKKINKLKFDLSYDDALRMGEEMLSFVKHATSLFEDNASSINPSDATRHQFAQSIHMFIMRKYLLALHRPFSLSVVRLPKCSYSRKICLEGSLEILSLMELPLTPNAIQYPHITQLGSGMFRDEVFHAASTVCVELSLQAQEMSHPGSAMEGMNSSVLMSMVQSQQTVMLDGVERTLHDFGRRIRAAGTGTKPYFFLSIILASVKSRIKGEDPLSQVEAASKKAVRISKGRLNGLSYSDALAFAENQPTQTPVVPDGTTPISASSLDLDLPSLLSTDFGDLASMDLGGWFDGLDTANTELWDNNLFGNLPPIP